MKDQPRGIFFAQDDARAVVLRLEADGYDATLARERYAGEDDDEDHPWAVTTDAPSWVLELLVEEREGWLDFDDPTALDPGTMPPSSPLGLPDAPRRIKRSPWPERDSRR